MKAISATRARESLYRLIDETGASHEPVTITGKRKNAVLVSEEDWKCIEETLYLTAIPGMRSSIEKGLKTPLSECSEELPW